MLPPCDDRGPPNPGASMLTRLTPTLKSQAKIGFVLPNYTGYNHKLFIRIDLRKSIVQCSDDEFAL